MEQTDSKWWEHAPAIPAINFGIPKVLPSQPAFVPAKNRKIASVPRLEAICRSNCDLDRHDADDGITVETFELLSGVAQLKLSPSIFDAMSNRVTGDFQHRMATKRCMTMTPIAPACPLRHPPRFQRPRPADSQLNSCLLKRIQFNNFNREERT